MRKFFRLGALLIILLSPVPAWAQWAVFDAAADVWHAVQTVQEVATAANTWLSNAHETLQIENQVKQLYNEAVNLAQLPLSLVNEVNDTMTAYQNMLNMGKGMVFSVEESLRQFEDVYNRPGSLMDKARASVGALRQASATMTAADSIFTLMCNQTSHVGKLLASSQAATGNLAATQASNQLLGVIASQNASLQEMTAAHTRMTTAYYMRQVTGEEAARLNAQQYLQLQQPPDWSTRPKQGFTLPD